MRVRRDDLLVRRYGLVVPAAALLSFGVTGAQYSRRTPFLLGPAALMRLHRLALLIVIPSVCVGDTGWWWRCVW